jgi:threonine dehydrogenase-like Zn-dependent dehydrogenase
MASKNTLPSQHRGLLLEAVGKPFRVEVLPVPQPSPGSAIVQVLAGCVLSYAGDRYSGYMGFLETPLIAGFSCVGRVAALGPDSTKLKCGDLVFTDPSVLSRDDENTYILQGHFHPDTEGSKLLGKGEWQNGTFAEYAKVPLENITCLNEARLLGHPEAGGLGYQINDLVCLNEMLIAYGGLNDANVKAGDKVLVAPATGSIGRAAVHVALALGAKVMAMARSPEKLRDLGSFDHQGRLSTITISGDVQSDLTSIREVAGGDIDVFFDISPPEAVNSSHIKSSILALRPRGRISLMGTFLEDVPLPLNHIMFSNITLQGTRMYTRSQREQLVKMVENGCLKLGQAGGLKPTISYKLEDWQEAFRAAKELRGVQSVALCP